MTFTWFHFETYVCLGLHYIKSTVKMDADLCLRDNLILFRCFAKISNFQTKFATTNSNFEKNNYLDMHYILYHVHVYKFPANSG